MRTIEHGEALRSALLTAVSHDLRAAVDHPGVGRRAAVPPEVELPAEDSGLLAYAIQDATGLTALATRGYVEVRVVDRGPGVWAELRTEMFEPFHRLGDTSPAGLGLGLAVAKGLAEAIGATCAPTAGTSSPPPTAGGRWTRWPRRGPTSSCSSDM